MFYDKRAIAVLPIVQNLIPTLSRKDRHCDCCWCDCEGAATEWMKERESFLDGQWYRSKVLIQFRTGKLEATRNGEQERGAVRERERVARSVRAVKFQALLKCSRPG